MLELGGSSLVNKVLENSRVDPRIYAKKKKKGGYGAIFVIPALEGGDWSP